MTDSLREGQELGPNLTLLSRQPAGERDNLWLALETTLQERVLVSVYPDEASRSNEVQAIIDGNRAIVHPAIARQLRVETVDDMLLVLATSPGRLQPFQPGQFSSDWPVFEQLLETLAYVHSLGRGHGNLDLASIQISDSGGLLLLDFGLPGWLTGRSPQDAQAADILALGKLLYLSLTGQAWQAEAGFQSNAPLPPDVRQLLLSMLDEDPASRFRDLGQASTILSALAEQGAAAKPVASEAFSRPQVTEPPVPPVGGANNAQLPMPWVLGGLAVLILLAGFVFFVLPNQVAAPTRQPPATAAPVATPEPAVPAAGAPTTAEAPLSPLQIARQERLKADAEAAAELLVRRQIELEDQGVLLWNRKAFEALGVTADAADTAYREEDYAAALEGYEATTAALDEMIAGIPDILAEAVSEGDRAISEGRANAAITHWTIATAIRPGNPDFERQLNRAENLESVLAELAAARTAERDGDLQSALARYTAAAALDNDSIDAAEGTRRVRNQITRRNFDDLMSRGSRELRSGDLDAARLAFEQAARLLPASPGPAEGLQQVDDAELRNDITELRGQALAAEAREDWETAIAAYSNVLSLDATLSFAADRLAEVESHERLYSELAEVIDDPLSLQDDEVLANARRIQAEAYQSIRLGPVIAARVNKLDYLLAKARSPVQLQITSDNRTDITVLKRGELGRISSTTLEVVPGRYTIIGKCNGYYDANVKVAVLPGIPPETVDVRCTREI